jgi:hypothetical protein
VYVELKLDESLYRLLDPQDKLGGAVCDAIEQTVSDVIRVLGIPGTVVVELIPWPRDGREAYQKWMKWMRLHINGQVCRFPDHLLRLVHSYVEEILPSPEMDARKVLDWLKNVLEDRSGSGRNEEYIAEFFALTCVQAIKESAGLLLADPQVEAYAASLPRPKNRRKDAPWPPSASALLPILRTVLNSKVSISDTAMMAQIFADTDRSEDTLVEDLLDALPSGTIDVCMPEALRRELDAAGPEREAELIKFLRDGLYEELGILYPEFRFISEERLKPNFTAFRINHLTTLPILCLRPDQCLVNDTVERLRSMNVEGWETTNPATWHPNAIVDVRRFLKKNVPHHNTAAGRIRISHLGNSGWRSKRRSTACMAFLPSAMPF